MAVKKNNRPRYGYFFSQGSGIGTIKDEILRYIDTLANPNSIENSRLANLGYFRDKFIYDNFYSRKDNLSGFGKNANWVEFDKIYEVFYLNDWKDEWKKFRIRVEQGEKITKTQVDAFLRKRLAFIRDRMRYYRFRDFITAIKKVKKNDWDLIKEIYNSWNSQTGGFIGS